MVRNITDVDDSILPKARELGVPYLELAEAEITRFHSDMDALGMRPPIAEPRATETIDEIVSIVERLLDSGHAYLTHGTAYFDVSTSPRFGTLSQYSRDQMVRLARARGGNPDDPHRRDPLDFVLWQPSLRRRARVARAVRRRPAGLAHRVLGDVDAGARPDARPARRRHRPHLPAPRVRGRAERGAHRQAVRAALAALGDGRLRGREDEQVARQPRLHQRPAEGGRPPRDPARADAPPLPVRLRVARHRHPGRQRAAAPARRRGAADAPAPTRRRSRSGCAPRSTRTSTRRRRSRRSASSPTPCSRAATTRPHRTCCAS